MLSSGALSISALIISKTRLIEPLILCHVFPQRSQDEEKVFRHFGHLLFEFNPATLSSYQRYARPPSLFQFWRCAPEEGILVQDQFDSGKDFKGVVHHQGLSYVLEIIRTKLTTENSRTRRQEILWRPAVVPNTYSSSEGHQLQIDPCHHQPADSLEGLIDGFATDCHIYELKRYQLQFDPHHCRLT